MNEIRHSSRLVFAKFRVFLNISEEDESEESSTLSLQLRQALSLTPWLSWVHALLLVRRGRRLPSSAPRRACVFELFRLLVRPRLQNKQAAEFICEVTFLKFRRL
jgi:hypothetical protein